MECNRKYKCEIWYESNENSKSYGPLKEWTKIKQINVKKPQNISYNAEKSNVNDTRPRTKNFENKWIHRIQNIRKIRPEIKELLPFTGYYQLYELGVF